MLGRLVIDPAGCQPPYWRNAFGADPGQVGDVLRREEELPGLPDGLPLLPVTAGSPGARQ
jgi:hypothetical protein